MGADTKKLRNRIKSVNSTLHLTKAMGLVASSKIRRATAAMLQGRQYADAVGQMIRQLSSCPECKKSPYMQPAPVGKTRIVVIAGDRGLAGGYNANVFRLAREYPDAEMIPIGKRASDRYSGKTLLAETFGYAEAITLARQLCEDFVAGEFDRLGIIGSLYRSMLTQEATIRWVLPLEAAPRQPGASVIFEPSEVQVLATAMPEYLAGVLLAAVRESFACEVAARRMAMDSAGKNAQEMIDDLQLQYNRARQGSITQEITEIVAGSNA